MSSIIVRRQKNRSPPTQPLDRHLSEVGELDGSIYINAGIDSTCCKKRSRTIHTLTNGIVVSTATPTMKSGSSDEQNDDLSPVLLNNRNSDDQFCPIDHVGCAYCDYRKIRFYSMMSTSTNEQISTEEYASSRHSTPNSSGGEKQFQFGSNNNIERGSGQNSRTSSVAEPIDGFSNYTEIIQHLQTVWNKHNHTNEGSRRSGNDETIPSHYSKGHSQQHYTHQQHNNQYSGHQNWNNYNNPRRSGGNGNYSRGYNSGNNDGYWNPRGNRFPTHRSVNSLMSNSTNYQQQSQPSPPAQRRPSDIQQQQQQQYHHNEQQQQPSQSYYKKNRSDHDRRPNGYNTQHQPSDYSVNNPHQTNNSIQNLPTTSTEQTNISSTQSFPSNLNSYNR